MINYLIFMIDLTQTNKVVRTAIVCEFSKPSRFVEIAASTNHNKWEVLVFIYSLAQKKNKVVLLKKANVVIVLNLFLYSH